jgi:hypothetical protein
MPERIFTSRDASVKNTNYVCRLRCFNRLLYMVMLWLALVPFNGFIYGRVAAFVFDTRLRNDLRNVKNRKCGLQFYSSKESFSGDPISDDFDSTDDEDLPSSKAEPLSPQQHRLPRIRDRVKDLARKMVTVPINVASSITPMPQAVASVLKDATFGAVDMAVEEGKSFKHFHTFYERGFGF